MAASMSRPSTRSCGALPAYEQELWRCDPHELERIISSLYYEAPPSPELSYHWPNSPPATKRAASPTFERQSGKRQISTPAPSPPLTTTKPQHAESATYFEAKPCASTLRGTTSPSVSPSSKSNPVKAVIRPQGVPIFPSQTPPDIKTSLPVVPASPPLTPPAIKPSSDAISTQNTAQHVTPPSQNSVDTSATSSSAPTRSNSPLASTSAQTIELQRFAEIIRSGGLPPLPSPSPSPSRRKQSPVKRVAAPSAAAKSKRGGFEIDKTNWVSADKDLEMVDGRPPIWCTGRQELCESLPYFRAYQGGHYDNGERCWGYLLEGFDAPLDRMEAQGRLIISHGGGCSEGDGDTYRLKEDQRRDNVRVRALLNCQRTQTPVVLLAGKNYKHFPYLAEVDVRYCVLGYYFVRDVWVEAEPIADRPEEFFTRFKFAFEWAPSQGKPWFTDVIGTLPSNIAALPPAALSSPASALRQSDTVSCSSCRQTFTRVFNEAIACYSEVCANFFKLPDGTRPATSALSYRTDFLRPVGDSKWPTTVPTSLFPRSIQALAHSRADYTHSAWRGYHCRLCGRLTSRSDWLALVCGHCGARVPMRADVYRAADLQSGPRERPVVRFPARCYDAQVPGYEGYTIVVGDDARVHHLWPVGEGALDKSDGLFADYQGQAAGELFKRNTLSRHRLPGSYLCSQFSFNTGAEYNHVVNVDTVPFDRPLSNAPASRSEQLSTAHAPPCVREACEYIAEVARLVCQPSDEVDEGFNEVLSVAYMEGGKMSYHDDGEQGLGPIVASLSLGADAAMNFRMKPKKKGAKAKKAKGDDGGEACGRSSSTKPTIQLQLRHGDLTIMEGRGVQRDLDHMVVPVNLRFAATARFISSSHRTRKFKTAASSASPGKVKAKAQKTPTTPTNPPEPEPEESSALKWPVMFQQLPTPSPSSEPTSSPLSQTAVSVRHEEAAQTSTSRTHAVPHKNPPDYVWHIPTLPVPAPAPAPEASSSTGRQPSPAAVRSLPLSTVASKCDPPSETLLEPARTALPLHPITFAPSTTPSFSPAPSPPPLFHPSNAYSVDSLPQITHHQQPYPTPPVQRERWQPDFVLPPMRLVPPVHRALPPLPSIDDMLQMPWSLPSRPTDSRLPPIRTQPPTSRSGLV